MNIVHRGVRQSEMPALDPASTTLPASVSSARAHRADPSSLWLRLWNWCGAALRDFCYLVMPGECAVCGCEDQGLCLICAAALRRETSAPFRAEGTADALMGVAGESHLAVMAGGVYRDALARSILAFKNHGRTELGPPLARCLVRSLQKALADIAASAAHAPVLSRAPADHAPTGRAAAVPPVTSGHTRCQGVVLLVPIPSTGSGWRRRGFDPVVLLLKMAVREGRVPEGVVIAQLLRSRTTLPWRRRHQKGLGRSARRANVRHALKVRPGAARKFLLTAKPANPRVLIIDDVMTTGSTLREASKTLQSWGFPVVGAVVLGATRAPDPGGPASSTSMDSPKQFRAKDE